MPIVDVPGVGRIQFPDGMTEEQMGEAIRSNFSPPPSAPEISTGGAALTGFNSMAGNFAHGTIQPLLESGFLGDSIAQSSKNVAQKRQREFAQAEAQHPIATNLGGVAGGIAATSPTWLIGGGATALGKAASLIGQGALTGAQSYVNEGDSRLGNAAIGAVAAPVMYGALKTGGYLLAKPINAIKNNLQEGAGALINLAKKYNVPVFAPDVGNSTALKGLGVGLENIPVVGLRGERQAQMVAAKNAAENVVGSAKDEMGKMGFGDKISLNSLQKIASGAGKRAEGAKKLLDEISVAGDDWNKIIETSGNLSLFTKKLKADEMSNALTKRANKLGDVDYSKTLTALRGSLNELSKKILPDSAASSTLNKINNNIFVRSKIPAGSLLDETGKPFTEAVDEIVPKSLKFSDLRSLRSDLGNDISDYYTGKNTAIGEKGVQYLQRVKSAIDSDLEKFALTKDPALKKEFLDFNNYYKTQVVPYKDAQLARALKGGRPDEIYNQFIKTGTKEGRAGTTRAQNFYNALDEKGRAAVRYGMVSNAFQKAYNSDKKMFSPAVFASQLDTVGAAKGVFFKGAAKAEIDGFKNLMRHVERSHIAINKPETGVQNIPYIVGGAVGGSAFLNPVGTAAGIASAYGMKKLMTTSAGRRLLLSSSKLAPGSPRLQKMLERSQKLLERGAVVQATKPEDNNAIQ